MSEILAIDDGYDARLCVRLSTASYPSHWLEKKQRGEGGNFLGFREQMELRIEEQNTEFDGCSCIWIIR